MTYPIYNPSEMGDLLDIIWKMICYDETRQF